MFDATVECSAIRQVTAETGCSNYSVMSLKLTARGSKKRNVQTLTMRRVLSPLQGLLSSDKLPFLLASNLNDHTNYRQDAPFVDRA